jgi:hypothetical protein
MDGDEKKTSPLLVVIAWTIVAVPLAWGVSQSLVKSLPLFRASSASSASPAPSPK